MADNELRIKMSIDNSDAVKGVEDFDRAAGKATSDAAAGTKKFEGATKDAARGVDGMTNGLGATNREVGNLIRSQMGLGAIKGLAEGIGNQWREVAENVARASREWQRFRQSLQGVSALAGAQNNNQFAAGEVDRAERAHVTPQSVQQFRDAFLSKASLYVGEGPAAKMSTQDADQFQDMLMEYAQQKGVGQGEMANFAGGLLAQQKGPISAKDMMARVGKTFATLEASSAPVSHLLPAMTRVMAQGYSAEDASRTLAALPEVAPEEEGTALLRVSAEMRRNNVEGRGEEFGMKEGMSPQQQLEALVGNLKRRSGGNAKELDKAIREFTHEDVAANTLRGMANQVNFDQWKGVQNAVPDDQLQKTIGEGRDSDAGRQYLATSRFEVEHARMGMRGDNLARLRQMAETQLMANRDFERPAGWAEYALSSVPGADSVRQQQINLQSIKAARSELGQGVGVGDAWASRNSGSTDELLRELIKQIQEQKRLVEDQNIMMRDDRRLRPMPSMRPPSSPNGYRP